MRQQGLTRFGSKNSENWLFSRFPFSSSVLKSPYGLYLSNQVKIKVLTFGTMYLSIFGPKREQDLVHKCRPQNLTVRKHGQKTFVTLSGF